MGNSSQRELANYLVNLRGSLVVYAYTSGSKGTTAEEEYFGKAIDLNSLVSDTLRSLWKRHLGKESTTHLEITLTNPISLNGDSI